MQKICIVGAGYVGLVTGACFAERGHKVNCVDIDPEKIDMLRHGQIPIFEPGLAPMVRRNAKAGRMKFFTDIKSGIKDATIVFICVNTPPKPNGDADLRYVVDVTRAIAGNLNAYKVIASKSTVPVQTGEKIKQVLRRYAKKSAKFDVASNPEFLREGQAVKDFLKPDRIVIGVESKKAQKLFEKLYAPFDCPKLFTNIQSAELIKHASNSFLACKISFANMVANICDKTGADIEEVTRGMGFDTRIGHAFLKAGVGFGGSCFPKDLKAFINVAQEAHVDTSLLRSIEHINEFQIDKFFEKIRTFLRSVKGKKIGVLGLSFKPDTDDMRNAPSIAVIQKLLLQGAFVKAYDPHAMKKASLILRDIEYGHSVYDAASGADMLLILTEWRQFKNIDLKKLKRAMKTPVVIDGRNIFDPAVMRKKGFKYASIGRS